MPLKVGSTSIKIPFAKAYVGDTLVYQSGPASRTISYYGTTTALMSARSDFYEGGVSFGNYAIFAGGKNSGGSACKDIDCYDSSLTKQTIAELKSNMSSQCSGVTGSYCVYAGGRSSGNVTAYDTSLTQVASVTALAKGKRYDASSISIDGYVIFAGGEPINMTTTVVEAYNDSLTRLTAGALKAQQWQFGDVGTSVGDYGIVAGGYDKWSGTVRTKYANAYDTNLTRTELTGLTTGVNLIMSASTDTYAFFGGGEINSSTRTNIVNIYDSDLTKLNDIELSLARHQGTATGLHDFVIFAGGTNGSNVVDIFDNNLTRTVGTSLSVGRQNLTSASVGNYLLIAGGEVGSTLYNTVDVYEAS